MTYWRSLLERVNQDLRQSEDWNLPETLESLNKVSDTVRLQAGERQELEALRTENEALQSDNAKFKAQVATLEKQAASLEAELRQNITSMDTIELSEGQSADLIKNRMTIGVAGVYSSWVDFNLNNEPHEDVEIGNSVEFPYAGQQCVIKVKELAYEADPPKRLRG